MELDATLCMARIWRDGYGGQCGLAPVGGGRFCARHGRQEGQRGWHGAVDGPVPPAKFIEFEAAKAKRANAEGQGARGGRKRLVRAGFLSEKQGVEAGAGMEPSNETTAEVESVPASSVGSAEIRPSLTGALAAGAAEARAAAEVGRGIGNEAKVKRMQQRSAARGREEQGGRKKK